MAETNDSIELDSEPEQEPESESEEILYPPFSIGLYRQHPLRRPIVYKATSPIPAKKAKRRPAYKQQQQERRKSELRKSRLSTWFQPQAQAQAQAQAQPQPQAQPQAQGTPFTPFFKEYTEFRILPSYCFHPRIHFLLSFFTTSIKQRAYWIEHFRKKPFQGSWKPIPPPAHIKKVKPMDALWSPTLVRHLSEAVQTTVTIRHTLRKFLHCWRVSRLKKANTEDPVLCDTPHFPIYIVDWSSSTQYVFDASTILQDLDSRLLHCDGFFDQSLPPRNSFTNQPFTLSQSVSIWKQLRSFSKEPSIESLFSWSYSSYKKASFCMKLFTTIYSNALKLHALRTTMADVKSWDSIDKLLDFIEYQHEVHNKRFLRSTYMYALQHIPHDSLIVEWRKLCCYYYEAAIKFINNAPILRSIQEDLKKLTAPLCERPTEIVTSYRSYLQQRSYEDSDEVLLNLQNYIQQAQQAFTLTEGVAAGAGAAEIEGAVLSDYDAVLQLLSLQNPYLAPIPLPILSIHGSSNTSSTSNDTVEFIFTEEDVEIVAEEEEDLQPPPHSP